MTLSCYRSHYFVAAIFLTYVSILSLILAFSTSYWLESYDGSYSDFEKMGLWSVCFKNYRHPTYQYDMVFNGCHYILSRKFYDIRAWLQPGWFVIIQALMSVSLIFTMLLFAFVNYLMLHTKTLWKVFLLALSFVLCSLSALSIFLSITVFGSLAFDRAWIQYPNYNHLSWSYGLAVLVFLLQASTSGLLLAEAFHARKTSFRDNIAYTLTVAQDL